MTYNSAPSVCRYSPGKVPVVYLSTSEDFPEHEDPTNKTLECVGRTIFFDQQLETPTNKMKFLDDESPLHDLFPEYELSESIDVLQNQFKQSILKEWAESTDTLSKKYEIKQQELQTESRRKISSLELQLQERDQVIDGKVKDLLRLGKLNTATVKALSNAVSYSCFNFT